MAGLPGRGSNPGSIRVHTKVHAFCTSTDATVAHARYFVSIFCRNIFFHAILQFFQLLCSSLCISECRSLTLLIVVTGFRIFVD